MVLAHGLTRYAAVQYVAVQKMSRRFSYSFLLSAGQASTPKSPSGATGTPGPDYSDRGGDLYTPRHHHPSAPHFSATVIRDSFVVRWPSTRSRRFPMSSNLAGLPQRYLRTPEAARFVGLSIQFALSKSTGSTEAARAIRSSAVASFIASRTCRPGWIAAPRRPPPTLASAPCCRQSAIAPTFRRPPPLSCKCNDSTILENTSEIRRLRILHGRLQERGPKVGEPRHPAAAG
jgi:hypothetical protein